jgi:hypothetical protein
LIGGGTMLVLLALIADLVSVNRKLLEKVDLRLGDVERHLAVAPSGLVSRASEAPSSSSSSSSPSPSSPSSSTRAA